MTHTTTASMDHIRARVTPDKVGFIVMLRPFRIGGLAFLTFLEHRHFTPVPLPCASFELAEIHWEEMVFALCLIPASRRPLAEAIAQELGLRFANGVPHVFTRSGEFHFPIDKPNLFTVENIPGHFVYRNNPAQNKTAEDYEMEAVNAAVEVSMRKLQEYKNTNRA
jgi:hypothetical protein